MRYVDWYSPLPPPPTHTQYYSQIPVMQVRGYLESCRNDHDEQGGPLTTDGGEVIMEETEYQAITQLKQVWHHSYGMDVHTYMMYRYMLGMLFRMPIRICPNF